MAHFQRYSCFLFLVALLPTFGGCIRPFTVPKNLFVHGTSPFTLPEGVRMIRREAHDEVDLDESPHEHVEDLHGRFRRDADGSDPEVSRVSFESNFVINSELKYVFYKLPG